MNSDGLEFSHSFGFGLLDAEAIVLLAKDWKTVPAQQICTLRNYRANHRPTTIYPNSVDKWELDPTSCGWIKFLEHLHLVIDLDSEAKRGDVRVELQSPSGTRSTLLSRRHLDEERTGFQKFASWPMMSVHFWGEPVLDTYSSGKWTLTIHNNGDKPCTMNDWNLIFYGTAVQPIRTAK